MLVNVGKHKQGSLVLQTVGVYASGMGYPSGWAKEINPILSRGRSPPCQGLSSYRLRIFFVV